MTMCVVCRPLGEGETKESSRCSLCACHEQNTQSNLFGIDFVNTPPQVCDYIYAILPIVCIPHFAVSLSLSLSLFLSLNKQ